MGQVIKLPLWRKFDRELEDFEILFEVEFESNPHWLISGVTGSGKTFYSIMLLYVLTFYFENSKIIICDFKGDDSFNFLRDYPDYYFFEQTRIGIDKAYDIMLERQAGNLDRSKCILYIDEYAAFIGYLSKKDAEDYKSKIKNILMLGRSLGVHLIISVQRASAELFSQARDQFSLNLILGSISKEVKNMFFSDFTELIDEEMGRGEGYILIDGQGFFKCKVFNEVSMDYIQLELLKNLGIVN